MAKFFKIGDVLINLDNVTSIMKIKRPIDPRKPDHENDVDDYEWGLYINYVSGSPDKIFPSFGFKKDIDRYMNVIYNENSNS